MSMYSISGLPNGMYASTGGRMDFSRVSVPEVVGVYHAAASAGVDMSYQREEELRRMEQEVRNW
jgi:hypothetical protein